MVCSQTAKVDAIDTLKQLRRHQNGEPVPAWRARRKIVLQLRQRD